MLKFSLTVAPLETREDPTTAQQSSTRSVTLFGNDFGSLEMNPTLRLPCHAFLDSSVNSTYIYMEVSVQCGKVTSKQLIVKCLYYRFGNSRTWQIV